MFKEYFYSQKITKLYGESPDLSEAVDILKTLLRGPEYIDINTLATDYCMKSMKTAADVSLVMDAFCMNYYGWEYEYYILLLKRTSKLYLENINIDDIKNLEMAVQACKNTPHAILMENGKTCGNGSTLDTELVIKAQNFMIDELEGVNNFSELIGIIARVNGLEIPDYGRSKTQLIFHYVFDHVIDKAIQIIHNVEEMTTIVSLVINKVAYTDEAKKKLLGVYFELGRAQLGEKPSYAKLIEVYKCALPGSELETMIIELIDRKSNDLTSPHVPIKKVKYFYETSPAGSVLKEKALNRIMNYIDDIPI